MPTYATKSKNMLEINSLFNNLLKKTPTSTKLNRLILLLLGIIILFVFLDKRPKSVPDFFQQTTPIPTLKVKVVKNIHVETPQLNDQISSGFLLTGSARVFENVINYRLKDTKGKVLSEGTITANAEDVGQFGAYEKQIQYSAPQTQYGYLEVFALSAKDGSEIDKQIIYLKFSQ